MLVTRYQNSATSENLSTLVALINDKNCEEVRLFASEPTAGNDYSNSDGPDTNLPLVAAIARYSIPGISDVYVLFDGLFLTAARRPRFLEVQSLMDAAQASRKVSFAAKPVPFTSTREPANAVDTLLSVEPLIQFTPETRAKYFALLSLIPEAQYP
ncbi:hypothetical protein [Chromobacterium violaceum]|uniref:hypothetical protein n=1 Tax=Chromobacterium violaceum TaxID=536 RepID=UPI0012D487EA|nr:hypothetical protein [Chromobacterium violaceum]